MGGVKCPLRMTVSLIFMGLAILYSTCSNAATIYVPQQYATIQAAVDASAGGDIVVVQDGTYFFSSPLTFKGKAITVRSANGPANCILDGQKTTQVITFESYEGNHSVLSGFTIQNGNAENGGGISLNGSSPTIDHCVVRGNRATSAKGGGIYCLSSSAIIKNCTIINNSAIGGSDAFGGGIYSKSGSLMITDCSIIGNYAEGSGGCSPSGAWAGYSFGGGIYFDGGSPTIRRSTLDSNTAHGGGCGPTRGTPLSYGGGIYCKSSSPTIEGCTIKNNSTTASDRSGGGAYFLQSSASLVNTIVNGNSAKNGAAMYYKESSATLINCTIVKNTASVAGGAVYALDSYPEIVNTILWENAPQAVHSTGGGNCTVTYSNISDGYAGVGNIDVWPDFIDISAQDFHLSSTSPCIDSGDANVSGLPETDKDGKSRVVNHIVDMGAYEYADIDPQVKLLISDYYQNILSRPPEPAGQDYWEAEVSRMQALGTDLKEVFRVMAGQFFNCPEYLGRRTTDDQYVIDLYRTFFNRAPDSGGFDYWMGELNAGLPRDIVLYAFLFSPEFEQYMQGLFGNTYARAEINMVGDFYRGLLGRLPDDGGFLDWRDQFRRAQCAGAGAVRTAADSISRLFLGSAEYSGRNRDNEQYVQDLYYAFLRRGADLGGFNYWVDQLDRGKLNREQVRQAFVAAPEFQDRVQEVIEEQCLSD